MIVCVCRRVSDKAIERHARMGADFDTIQFELGVATQCGKCEGCARNLWVECQQRLPVAHVSSAEAQPQNTWANLACA